MRTDGGMEGERDFSVYFTFYRPVQKDRRFLGERFTSPLYGRRSRSLIYQHTQMEMKTFFPLFCGEKYRFAVHGRRMRRDCDWEKAKGIEEEEEGERGREKR